MRCAAVSNGQGRAWWEQEQTLVPADSLYPACSKHCCFCSMASLQPDHDRADQQHAGCLPTHARARQTGARLGLPPRLGRGRALQQVPA